jgi:trimeric autotransporter adhesin
MADNRWLGRAKDVAAIFTVTPGGTIGTETFTITLNGKSITYTAVGGDLVADVVDGLLAAWNVADDDFAEFAELTSSDSSTHLTLTAVTKGVEFTTSHLTSTASGAGTLVTALTTTATGKNWWNNINNWSAGTVPANTEDIFLDYNDVDILYGLDASAVTVASLNIHATYTGRIGLPVNNDGGYTEFRDDYLQISATTTDVGKGDGDGSGRLKINYGSNVATINIHKTSESETDDAPAFIFLGTHADNAIELADGTAGLAVYGDETGTLKTITQTGGRLTVGDGATLNGAGSTWDQTGGESVIYNANMLTVNIHGGTMLTQGSGTITTLTIDAGGRFNLESTGTITTANVYGLIDCTVDQSARTITTLTLYPRGGVVDPGQSITVTNGFAIGTGVQQISAT